ncbi:MAG: methyltransferase domain-containing protein, partial [Sphingopyxis sp.]
MQTVPIPTLSPNWPDSWKLSHQFDRIEIGGEQPRIGYARMYSERRRRVLASVAQLAGGPADILDIAAAQGNFSIAVAAMGHRVTWNDFRGELADYVRMKMPAGMQMAFVPGNILEVEAEYQSRFDVVMALEVIEHVAHPDAFLRALSALVKPGGHIIVSTP